MSKKIIFLDIDGTICEYGVIRPTAITAIQKARENGHKVFLCTGRSVAIINSEILEIGFDGIVASAGAYVEIDGKAIHHKTFDKELLSFAIDYFEQYQINYYLETNTKFYGTEENIKNQKSKIENRLKSWENTESNETSNVFSILESMFTIGSNLKERTDITKIAITSEFRKISQIQKDVEGKLEVIPSTIKEMSQDNGEVSQVGITKALGIQRVIEYLDIPWEATIAVGDGSNDFEMIQYAKIGIAMGNGLEELKKVADYVTEPIDEDGLYRCFDKFGLLS